jgi:hypothetical protein
MKKKTLVYILIGIFLISLIPLYVIGDYAHPSVDDYYYGVETSTVWEETGSISAVLKESFAQMLTTYEDWQGNFSAIFLMRLQPGIFGEEYYIIAPIILITSFVVSMLVFFYYGLRKWFNAGKTASLVTAVSVTFCALHFTHVPSDSFYWYNGAIYYTFFYALMLVLLLIITIQLKSQNTAAKIISFILGLPLAFIIGGGNYATALVTAVMLLVIVVWHVIKKEPCTIPVAILTVCMLAGFAISMLAPGNSIRQNSVGEGPGVIKALAYSFAYGGYNIANSTTFPVAVMWIALLPVFYRMAAGSSFKFKYPIIMLLFTFGIFCCQGTPVFFAQGLRMPYRMMNIIYFSYYIFMTWNIFYLMGWIHRKWGHKDFWKKFECLYESAKTRHISAIVASIAFAIGCVGLCNVTETEYGQVNFSGLPAGASATYSLINGDAKTYDEELTYRATYLSSTEKNSVCLPPLSAIPEVIFHSDITEDPYHWKNQHLCLYYNKQYIWIEK